MLTRHLIGLLLATQDEEPRRNRPNEGRPLRAGLPDSGPPPPGDPSAEGAITFAFDTVKQIQVVLVQDDPVKIAREGLDLYEQALQAVSVQLYNAMVNGDQASPVYALLRPTWDKVTKIRNVYLLQARNLVKKPKSASFGNAITAIQTALLDIEMSLRPHL